MGCILSQPMDETRDTHVKHCKETIGGYTIRKPIYKDTVYAGVRISDNSPVAIKYVVKGEDSDEIPLELELLCKAQAVQGVIRLLDFYETKESFVYVMEKGRIDLYDFITEQKMLTEALAKDLFQQIVVAVIECHRIGLTHGDIKDENIIIDETNHIKLIDFGAAAYFHEYFVQGV